MIVREVLRVGGVYDSAAYRADADSLQDELRGGVRHVGSFYSYQYDSAGYPRVPSTTLFDAHLEYDFGALDQQYEGVSLNVTATNLFNEKNFTVVDSGFTTFGPGREVVARLAYRW